MALISANAPLPLQGTYNTRDLGGYPAGPGAVCAGRFLRSDQPAGLGEGDLEALYRYGVRLSIDLRSGEECRRDVYKRQAATPANTWRTSSRRWS